MMDIFEKQWDVIVIGAGLGGGICGRALAEAGLSVLYLERGPDTPRHARNNLDCELEDPKARERIGAWPVQVEAHVNGVTTTSWGMQGVGAGGTSAFYAAALERPERHDFEDIEGMPHPTGGWPVGYDAFAPWYDRAQKIMHINGSPDPLGPPVTGLATPRALAPRDAALGEALTEVGLHPYRAHLGIRQLEGCLECIGHKCPRPCKMDGRSAGVEPAIATGRAALLDTAIVLGLAGTGRRVSGVRLLHAETEKVVTARTYVMAAGGLGSPRLLLASASDAWPNGCANSTGLVGRGLMFHLTERIAIWPPRKTFAPGAKGPAKAFSLRDFYRSGTDRMGLFQSLGLPASYGNIVYALRQQYEVSRLARFGAGKALLRIPAFAAARVLGDARVFAGILEDLPREENRVRYDPARPDAIIYDYTMSSELLERRQRYRRLIKKGLGRIRSIYLNHAPELNITHPCGTLRFSEDPAKGVLDPSCRAHDLDNLYVVDASFMPTSTGVNPGLTIVANALRVADIIATQFGQRK